MDALLIAGFVLAVLALMAWLFTMLAITYILYKYVLLPWRIMRIDVRALADKVKMIDAAMTRNSIQAVDDTQAARVEARLEAQRRAQMAGR